jgi:hypothetical protein
MSHTRKTYAHKSYNSSTTIHLQLYNLSKINFNYKIHLQIIHITYM